MEVGLFSIGMGRTSDPDRIAHVARQADDVGLNSLWVPEHTVLFDEADDASRYPDTDTGRMMAGRGNLLDPFAALGVPPERRAQWYLHTQDKSCWTHEL
jgi:alkanesulfonate monooxygenase SsuD/methylene tetrahydromethanopterin reductase-like flavin-dependent oxidoreductase (luciferase family)